MKIVCHSAIDDILKKGISLSHIGLSSLALEKNDALEALSQFAEIKIAVLGGDVCELKDGIIQHNYDSWHCEQRDGESSHAFILRSVEKAKKYIESYPILENERIFFVLVPQEPVANPAS